MNLTVIATRSLTFLQALLRKRGDVFLDRVEWADGDPRSVVITDSDIRESIRMCSRWRVKKRCFRITVEVSVSGWLEQVEIYVEPREMGMSDDDFFERYMTPNLMLLANQITPAPPVTAAPQEGE